MDSSAYQTTPSPGRPQRHRWGRGALLIILLAGLLLLPSSVAGQAPREVQLDELVDNLDDYLGQSVLVTGEVKDVIDRRTFVLGEGGVAGVGGVEVLVMSTTDPALTIDDGQELRVTGRVGRFDLAAFEQAIGGQLDDTPYADWDGDPVLVLQAVEEQ